MQHFLRAIPDPRIRSGLFYSIIDGVLWAIMFGFAENYLVPFALLFGATTLQVSLIQGVAQFGVGLSQLIGARFILKFRQRKRLAILMSRMHALSWLLVLFLTIATRNPWMILIFYGAGISMANIGGPGWISWMNELVPTNLRGEFWGIRNRIIGLTQFAAIAVAGLTLQFANSADYELQAYIALFSLAFVARFANVIPLTRMYEPPMSVPEFATEFRFRIFLTRLFTTNFGRFALFSITMTFSVNVMGPIIPVYVLRSLEFNYAQFTAVMMAVLVFSFISMTYWGPLSDMYGNYRILFATAIMLPLLPVGWIVFKQFPVLLVLQVFNGFVLAGFNLSTTNYIFDAVRQENISKIMAYFNTLNTSCAFLGAITGGFLVTVFQELPVNGSILNAFTSVFLISAILRLIVVAFFLRRFTEVRPVEHAPGLHFFYIYRPAYNIVNRFQMANAWIFKSVNGRRENGD